MSKSEEKINANAKKRLLIIIAAIVVVIIVLFAVSLIIDKVKSSKNDEFIIDYNFYPADYEENIFEDEEYINLTSGNFIKYQDLNTNITVGITRENANQQSEQIAFIVEMLYDIIEGKHEEYNACFSDVYYKNNSPKSQFTMQKVYDVTVSYISQESVSDDSGNYTKYLYSIEYKILENNGTFRKDIGSGSKKQYATLTDRQGNLLIDALNTQIVKY